MCHLNVVDRILLALRARQVHVEGELGVALAHEEEVSDRVTPDIVHEVAHGDVAAGPLRDLHLLATAQHRHELVQHVLGVARRDADAERLQPRAHARDRAVVIGALHVDRPRKAALPLGDVVRNVRQEIRERAALLSALAHHPVLIVPVVSGTQEQRTILLVRIAGRDERNDRLVHTAVTVKRGFEVVGVERDAECLKVEVLLLAQLLHGKAADRGKVVPLGVVRVLLYIPLGDLGDVRTVIATIGNRERSTAQLAHTCLRAEPEVLDLDAGVVVVEFTRDAPSIPLEQRRDGVTERGLPAMPDVQRSCRIGAHELDDDGLVAARRRAAVRRAGGDERGDAVCHRARVQAEVDEARACNLRRGEAGRRAIEGVDQPLRQVTRLLAKLLREHHGDVRRPIAKRRVAWALEERHDVIRRTERDSGASDLSPQRIRTCAHSPALDLGAAGAGFDSALGAAFFASAFLDSPPDDDGSPPFALSPFAPSAFADVAGSPFAPSDFGASDEDAAESLDDVASAFSAAPAVGGASPRCAFLP